MSEILFSRKIYSEMLKWKKEYAPAYALFLKGARRVGKTTLAEKLGAEEYKTYILISFDKVSDDIKKLFLSSLDDLEYFFNVLQLNFKTKLYEHESLIILDEIQLFPEARQALKTLLKDSRYHYLETGSLAIIKKKGRDILIPSEEYPLDVLPLDFEEFLWATDDYITMDLIRTHYENKKEFKEMYNVIKKSFREYMLVGGMPQAVLEYIKSKDLSKVDFIKQRILDLYESDMVEQKEENSIYVKSFFDRIPSELSKHDKKYILTHVSPNARFRDYGGPIEWLDQAMIINIANSITDPNVALNLSVVDASFKCYMMDTGLLISLAYRDGNLLDNELYKAILLDKLHINEGMIVENMVAQALRYNKHNMCYYKKVDKESKRTVIDVDFLIRKNNKVLPIEVKSSRRTTIKSLKAFRKMFPKKLGEAYVLYDGDIKIEDDVVYLPYFMASVI